ncbi:MAG: hypothetical protein U0521_23440 [Anaerolineae bacterium]
MNITGTVNPPDLQSYFFEVADANADPNTVVWTPVTLPSHRRHRWHARPVQHDHRQNGVCIRLRPHSGEITVVTVTPLHLENDPNAAAAGHRSDAGACRARSRAAPDRRQRSSRAGWRAA